MQVVYNPQVLLPASKLGDTSEVLVQDASALARPLEELTFWQLQVGHLQWYFTASLYKLAIYSQLRCTFMVTFCFIMVDASDF